MTAIKSTPPEPGEKDRSRELFTKDSLTSTTALLVYLALADFVFHILFANNSGYFRDELYYIVSGTQHLSLGYVDFPPFIAYVAFFLNIISGDSLLSIHIVSALAEAVLVIVTGLLAKELGGGRKAQLLAAFSTCVTLTFLADGSLFSPDAFDQLWWSLLAYLVIRIVKRKEPQSWVYAGLVIGIGLLTKLTIVFFVGALVLSFLAIPSTRKYLYSKWILVGGLFSFIFIVPMISWNLVNGWPMVNFYLEFRGDVSGGGPLGYFIGEIGAINYFNIPITVIGLYFYLKSKEGSELRAFGFSYILLYVFMTIINAKTYYLLPIYPMLYAGGALLIEKSYVNGTTLQSEKNVLSKKRIFGWFGSRPYVATLILFAALIVPLLIPILPPSTVINIYAGSIASTNSNGGSGETGPLPQTLGDRYGWNAMVLTLAQVYNTLTANEKSQACIFTENYGEASAVNFLGKSLGLPEAISGHNNYYVWGPGSCTGQVLITVHQLPMNF